MKGLFKAVRERMLAVPPGFVPSLYVSVTGGLAIPTLLSAWMFLLHTRIVDGGVNGRCLCVLRRGRCIIRRVLCLDPIGLGIGSRIAASSGSDYKP
jgi:hypothetical protein